MHGGPEVDYNILFGITWGDPEASCPGELTPRPYETISPEPGRGEPDRPGAKDAERHGAKEAGSSGREPAVPKEDNRSPASGGDAC